MSEIIETTQEEEVKSTTAEIPAEPTTVEEKTIGDMVDETIEVKPNMIPESVFLGEKKARKEAERKIKELQSQIAEGASNEDITDSIDDIAEEHDIDKSFLKKLAKSIKADTEKELDAKYASKFESRDKQSKFDDAFKRELDTALERGQEFKGIVNVDIIKSLALLPQNAKKTVSQILEETYGNAITGKRTIETTSPGGGKEPAPLDYEKAQRDTEYFKEVMADPKKKAQYNEQMIKKGF